MSNLHQIFIRYIKYASSTLVGTIVDMLILWFLSTELLHSYIGEYIISPCISFECAVIANYLVAYHFVWKDRVLLHPQKNGWFRFLKYNGSCILGFSIKMCILLLLKHLFQWNVLLCNIVALLFSGGLNFLLQHFWVFSKKRHKINRIRRSSDVKNRGLILWALYFYLRYLTSNSPSGGLTSNSEAV